MQLRPEGFFGEKTGEPIALLPNDWKQLTTCMALGLGIYIGGEVTNGACASAPNTFWRFNDGSDQSIAGGHCMYASGYIKGGSYGEPNLSIESWGSRFYTTWSWWTAHIDEAYVLVDLARPASCFNLEALRADIAALHTA